MKLQETPVGSTILFNGNEAIVISHGLMGCYVNVTAVKMDDEGNPVMNYGKQVLSNLSEVSILKKRGE